MNTAEKMSKEVAEYFEWMLKENHFKFFKKGEFQVDDFLESEVTTSSSLVLAARLNSICFAN